MKRMIAVILTMMLTLGLLAAPGYAAQGEAASPCAGQSTQAELTPSEAFVSGCVQEAQLGVRTLTEAYLAAEANGSLRSSLPAKYDGRTYGYLTPVRSQRPYAVCWAYATVAALEAYAVKHGVTDAATGLPATTALDLSESHLSWFSYAQAYDALGMLANDRTVHAAVSSEYPAYMMAGGSASHAVLAMMRWDGAAPEQVGGLSKDEVSDAGLDPALAWQYDSLHVQSAEQIACANRDAVKQAILEYGAGTVSIRVPTSASDCFYTGENTALCYTGGTVNHAVALVGWDDDYSVDHFPADRRPARPGAWLCKNSWGAAWGSDGGYFYLSYEDVPSSQSDCWFIAAESADNYDNIYQYDGTACLQGSAVRSGERVANCFTANGDETLEAVSIGSYDEAVSYTLEIYTDPTDAADPGSGTLRATQSGSFQYGGYHTVRLNEPVSLSEGQRYAVVFQLSAADRSTVTVAIDKSCCGGWYDCYHSTPANSSFYTQSQGVWAVREDASYRIKAYTCNAAAPDPVPVTYYVHGVPVQAVQGRDGGLVTLPSEVATPDGYEFVGWTNTPLSCSAVCPSFCAPGAVAALDEESESFYALFQKQTAYTLVTAVPERWDGKYVLTTEKGGYGKVLRGVPLQGTSIGGDELSVSLTESGIQWAGTLLSDVDPAYVFELSQRGDRWSMQNLATGNWLSSVSGYLVESAAYSGASGAWTPSMNGNSFVLRNVGKSVYLSVNQRGFFAVDSAAGKPVYLWKLMECYTTFSDDWEPSEGADYVSSLFSDVPAKGHWSHDPIEWAYVNGITGGTDATHFSPDKTVMRADAMVFFWAAKNRPGFSSAEKTFKDVKKKHWAYSAVMWAVENGITGGTDATHFSPSQTCSRSEILQFLYAAMGKPGYTIENPYSDVKDKHWYKDGAIWAYENGLEKGENGKFQAKTPCTRAYVVTYLYRFITGNALAS